MVVTTPAADIHVTLPSFAYVGLEPLVVTVPQFVQ
jgi:hypothetical protein